MSEIKVNKLSPRTNCGTVQLGDSGDTITIPAGATSCITASPVTRAGGGAGGASSVPTGPVSGGAGGGAPSTGPNGTAGTTNTGGGGSGGAGCAPGTGGAGGSGVVIIRYKFQ